jgi:hypothetical protein
LYSYDPATAAKAVAAELICWAELPKFAKSGEQSS